MAQPLLWFRPRAIESEQSWAYSVLLYIICPVTGVYFSPDNVKSFEGWFTGFQLIHRVVFIGERIVIDP